MSLKTRLLCGFRLFLLGKPSWDLVIHSILQVVDAFYASLQIRCTAHNPRIAGFTEYKITYLKGPTFSFAVYCCTQRVGWRSQRQSKKVNIRNACFLPVRAKSGRFCVLMIGRVLGHRKLFVFGLQQQSTLRIGRTEGRIQMIWLSQIGSLFRRTQKPVRQQGVPSLPDPSPRGSQDTRGVLPQPSLAACVRRRP